MSHNHIQVEIDYLSNFFKDIRICEDLAILPYGFGSIYYWHPQYCVDFNYNKFASIWIGGTEYFDQRRYFICG